MKSAMGIIDKIRINGARYSVYGTKSCDANPAWSLALNAPMAVACKLLQDFEAQKISIRTARSILRIAPVLHKAAAIMSKAAKGAAGGVDTIVKLIVGAGQASPSPPVGPALGSKGVKSMDFCKVCISIYSICTTVAIYMRIKRNIKD